MLGNAIALKLIQYIVDNELAAGSRLPSIRELAALWDCNQSQIRTGLITLSALGIIDMHPRAGSFVKKLDASDIDTLFVLVFRLGMLGKDVETLNVYAVKTLLDKEIIQNAIHYRTDDDLFQLEENLARQATSIEDCDAFVAADEEFHLLMARITRNPVITFLLEAIQVMLRPYRHKSLSADICRESCRSHREIYEAIKKRDEVEGEKLAVQHTLPRMQRLRAKNESAIARAG